MWIGERIYFLSRPRRRRQPLLVPPDGADLRRHTDHDDYYARHAQTDGRRIVYQCGARPLAVRSGDRRTAPVVDRAAAVASHAGRAQVRAGRRLPDGMRRASGRAQRRRRCARQAVHASRCGKARCASTARRRRPLPARPVAGRRHDARRGQRRIGRGARRGLRRDGATRALPTGTSAACIAMRAAPRGQARRDRQPSQRGADRRPRRAAR